MRVQPDGSVHVDTVEEAVAVSRCLAGAPLVPAAENADIILGLRLIGYTWSGIVDWFAQTGAPYSLATVRRVARKRGIE
jgi:hypothetical protein